METKENIVKYNINISNKNEKNNVENNNKKIFYKTNSSGVSLIVLVITIIVIIILATAIILTLNKNNPIAEANRARYESDRDNMQSIFTNTVAKVMAQNKCTMEIKEGELNEVKSGVNSTIGEATYTLNNPEKSENKNGKIIFDNKDNTEIEYYTGRKLPIYSAGETIWSVDSEGVINLKVGNNVDIGNGGSETGDGNEKDEIITISKEEYNNILNEIKSIKEEMQNMKNQSNSIERVSLLDTPFIIFLETKWTDGNFGDIILNNSISNYKYLEITTEVTQKKNNNFTDGMCRKTDLVIVDQLKYNNTNTVNYENGSTISLTNHPSEYSYIVCGYFKNDKNFHISGVFTNDARGTANYLRIKSIYGIK